MILPIIKCSRVVALAIRMAPTTMIEVPRRIMRLRPRGLPMKIVATAPKKHPKLYDATEIPGDYVSAGIQELVAAG